MKRPVISLAASMLKSTFILLSVLPLSLLAAVKSPDGKLEVTPLPPVRVETRGSVTFADFGQVWSRGGNDASLRNSTLRTTPGIGARIYSPIGVVRLDFGYNNYAPRTGAAYFNELARAKWHASAALRQSRQRHCVARGD